MMKFRTKGDRVEVIDGHKVSGYRLSRPERTIQIAHSGRSLDIVAFSDWRTQNISSIAKFLEQRRSRPDLIVYAGDDVRRFRFEATNYFEDLARHSAYGLAAVAGNDDFPECRELIEGGRVYPVHSLPLIVGDFSIVGLEGAPLFPDDPGRNRGRLMYPLNFRRSLMKSWMRALRGKRLIVISHAPPEGVLDFAVRFGPRHIGCPALREFLDQESNCILCVCGHVHLAGGKVEVVGKSTVVNAASHDGSCDPGRIASIPIRNGRVDPQGVQWSLLN